jgi:hypothetical protein
MIFVFELRSKKQLHFRLNLDSSTAWIIKAGLDAPHLGVGIAAGEAASYDVYKEIMDIVIKGWGIQAN